MKSPIVSVIIPVYNNEKYIKETIESVLNQTFTDFELLLIEDCSTDNTLECIRNIEDERIRLYQNDENKGIAYTRNVGLKKAVGQYIALIDGDDIMTPERLQMQLNLLTTNPHIDCCAGQGVLINAKSEEIGSLNKVSGDLNLILIFQNVVINPSLTFRKSITDKIGYYEDYSPAEDYHFILKAVFNEFHFFNMTEILIKYRVHDSNASGNIKSLTNAENRIVSYIFTSLKYPQNSKSTAIHTSIIQQNYTLFTFSEYAKHLISFKGYYFENKNFSKKEFNEYLFFLVKKIHILKNGKPNSFKLKMIKMLHFSI